MDSVIADSIARRDRGDAALARSEALFGASAVARLGTLRVAVVGVGGVGSWCAEALVRTGVRRLVLVDDDRVAASNLNRQCEATAATVGAVKVEAMRDRLLSVVPEAEVAVVPRRFESAADFAALGPLDAVVDAIDSVSCKAELILAATAAGVPVFSSMGAALRTDPTRVTLRPFDKVEGDGLARALRQRFRRLGRFPARKFVCAVSTEPPLDRPERGSVMCVTAAFGLALASEVVRLAR